MYSHPSIEHLRPLPFHIEAHSSAAEPSVNQEDAVAVSPFSEGAAYEDLSPDALRRLLKNTARVASRKILQGPWWVLAHEILAVGSTTAYRLCSKANLDPDEKVSLT